MESLLFIAAIIWSISFVLIVWFSHARYKYTNGNADSSKSSLRVWKTQGVRTAYYRLAIATSGLFTMAAVALVQYLFY